MIGSNQDRQALLRREVPMALALLRSDESINCLKVFDVNNGIDYGETNEQLGMNTAGVGLHQGTPDSIEECDNQIDFAIAYGAALGGVGKNQGVNFRNDFMPYMGQKIRMQKMLMLVSIIASILLIVLGIFIQIPQWKINQKRRILSKRFEKEYTTVMLVGDFPKREDPVNKLSNALRKIRNIKSGKLSATGEASIAAKVTLVLESFNKIAKQTDLNIEKIAITSKSIRITGDTSSRKNTLKLFEALKDKLEVQQSRYDLKGGRDNFTVTVAPKQ